MEVINQFRFINKPELRRLRDYLGQGDLCHAAVNRLPRKTADSLHCHDFFEVFWLTSGRSHHFINGEKQTLKVGDLVFIKPKDQHTFQALQERTTLINISLPRRYVRSIRQRYQDFVDGHFFWHTQNVPPVVSLSEREQQELSETSLVLARQANNPILLDHVVLNIFRRLHDHVDQFDEVMPNWLKQAIQGARDPHVFKQGAAGFVALAGKGHEHVCRSTKRYLSKTPSEIINQIRCEHAAKLLIDGIAPIGDISEHCGYDNSGHFFKQFKKYYDQTPKQYRLTKQQRVV